MITFVYAARRSLADKAFENLVGQPVGGRQRQVERGRIGDAGAVEIRSVDLAFARRATWICADAPWTSTTRIFSDQRRATSSSSVAKLSSRDDGAVNRQDERLVSELRNVLEDAPQVGQLHSSTAPWVASRGRIGHPRRSIAARSPQRQVG